MGETAPSRGQAFREPLQSSPRGRVSGQVHSGGRGAKALKNLGRQESVLAWLPPLTLPRQKPSHPFNSTLSGWCTRSVRWQVERAGPQPYPRMLGHAQLGAVLEGATSFQALLERHPSSFPWLTPKGQKACQETPGSGLGLWCHFLPCLSAPLCVLCQLEQNSAAMETANTRQSWPLHLAAQPREIMAFVVIYWMLKLSRLYPQALTRGSLTPHHQPLL